MTSLLRGRTAVVTGAGNGLGRATAMGLAAEGVRVVPVGRDRGKLDRVAQELRALHSDVAPLVCDISDVASVDIAARALEALDVSILVNNAGIGGPVSPLVDIDPDEWDAVFAVNVRGVYLMCRALLPGMIARGSGDVINLASVLGKRPMAARTAYAASKAAVIALTASLAFEVGPHGVRVNTLSPGPVDGQRMERNFRLESERRNIPYEQAQQEYVSRAAAQRMVTEAEVAAAAVAMLGMTGLNGANVDLSAGMVA